MKEVSVTANISANSLENLEGRIEHALSVLAVKDH